MKIAIIYAFSSKFDMYLYLHTASACRKSAPPTEPPVRIRSSLEGVSLKKDKPKSILLFYQQKSLYEQSKCSKFILHLEKFS